MIRSPPSRSHPPPTELTVFIFKSVYCDYNGFPTKQKLHIKILDIETIKKRHKQTRLHKELSWSFFFYLSFFNLSSFYTTNPTKRFPVPFKSSHPHSLLRFSKKERKLSTGMSSPGRHLGLQVPSQPPEKQVHFIITETDECVQRAWRALGLNLQSAKNKTKKATFWSSFRVDRWVKPLLESKCRHIFKLGVKRWFIASTLRLKF